MPIDLPPQEFLSRYSAVYAYLTPRVELLLQVFPEARVTSWYRDPAKNLRVGGDRQSQHLFAFAADLDHPTRNGEVAAVARGLGLVVVEEATHVHLQVFRAGVLARAGFFA